ncbi:MAG TPA: amidohydrolase family protein [Dehalococcoidia bacterium]|nr:amidohydrolase family protein [Dehalococcoidia bacterium]
MIIDGHAHLDLDEITAEDYIRLMDASGISKVVLLASLNSYIPPTPDWQIAILRFLLTSPLHPFGKRIYESIIKKGAITSGGKNIQIIQDPDNDSVSHVISKYPDRFIGFVIVNPKLEDAMETFEKGIEEQGMVGVKCHAWWHRFDPSSDLIPIARRCEEKGLPILMHLGGGPQTGNFQGLLEKCPRLKLILAHAAIPFFGKVWGRVKEEKNCFVDISGSYLNASIARKAVKALGPDKVIFGSDGPVSLRCKEGHSYEPILQWTRDLPISESDREKIFSGNLLKLLP